MCPKNNLNLTRENPTMFEKLKFAALTHDLGKVFSRRKHAKATVALLKAVIPLNYMILKSSV